MQVTGIGYQNNQTNKQAFGTAFIRFNKAELDRLPECYQDQVKNILSKDLSFVPVMECIFSLDHPQKRVAISQMTDNVALRYTDKNSQKEADLVRIVKKLFGLNKVETTIIANTPKNAKEIEKKAKADEDWVILGR